MKQVIQKHPLNLNLVSDLIIILVYFKCFTIHFKNLWIRKKKINVNKWMVLFMKNFRSYIKKFETLFNFYWFGGPIYKYILWEIRIRIFRYKMESWRSFRGQFSLSIFWIFWSFFRFKVNFILFRNKLK